LKMERSVSIITVNRNGRKFLASLFDSIFSMEKGDLSLEVIMIDNLSQDGSTDLVRETFPQVKIIENDVNNYARALNLGIRHSRGDYVAFLNNDTVVEKNWLKGLIDILSLDEKIGAVQSKILFSDAKTINSVGGEEIEDFYFRDLGFGEKDVGQYEEAKERDYVSGGSVIFRRHCLESVGDYDEDFMMYFEDMDYSIRCRQKGWKLFYAPQSVVYHEYHGTASSALCEYFCSRNRLLCLAKHFPRKLPQSLKTSHFYINKDYERLYHSLIQAMRKLVAHHDTETVLGTLDALKKVVLEVFVPQKAYHFFRQLEVALGLRKISVGIYDHAFHFPGGGQRYVAHLAELLQDRCDVTYIANKDAALEKYKEWFDVDLSRCKLKIIKIPFHEQPDRYFIDEGLAVHEKTNPFAVISRESLHYDIFINANMLTKVMPRSCVSIFLCHFPDRVRERFFSVDQYDYLITNSDYSSSWTRRRWGLNPTMRIYPPVHMYSEAGGTTDKEKMILSVARFEIGGTKKQIEMIDAFCNLCKRDPRVKNEWRLVLAGGSSPDSPYFDRVRKRVECLQADNIELMPDLTNAQLMELYRKASIFWHLCGLGERDPHRVEHFGMTTVEAMQNYCVPIVIDGGGQKEIVEHGISGFRFKTSEELEAYTLKVMRDESLRQEMAAKAYKRSFCFSLTIFKEKFIEFFSNIENRLLGGEIRL